MLIVPILLVDIHANAKIYTEIKEFFDPRISRCQLFREIHFFGDTNNFGEPVSKIDKKKINYHQVGIALVHSATKNMFF